MGDRLRLMITGVVAVGAVGLAMSGQSVWSAFDDDEPHHHEAGAAQLKDFDGITLRGPDNVIVTPGPAFSVKAEGDGASVKYLTLDVEDGVLRVSRQNHGSAWGGQPVTVHVTMPGLTRVWIMGSGHITADKLQGKAFSARVDGSGGLKIGQLASETVRLSVVGSGSVDLGGTARDLNVNLEGSGHVAADGLKAQSADVTVTGSGGVRAHADQNAKLLLRGSGNAQVDGTTQCQIEKTGSGEATCTT